MVADRVPGNLRLGGGDWLTIASWLGVALAVPGLVMCTSPAAPAIVWDDGDSGSIGSLDFRLADVDAPETGGVGAAIGGALCEAEREAGQAARAFMTEAGEGDLTGLQLLYQDRYGRWVVHLEVDRRDVAAEGLAAGVLRPWPHDLQGRALAPKPDWCGEAGE